MANGTATRKQPRHRRWKARDFDFHRDDWSPKDSQPAAAPESAPANQPSDTAMAAALRKAGTE